MEVPLFVGVDPVAIKDKFVLEGLARVYGFHFNCEVLENTFVIHRMVLIVELQEILCAHSQQRLPVTPIELHLDTVSEVCYSRSQRICRDESVIVFHASSTLETLGTVKHAPTTGLYGTCLVVRDLVRFYKGQVTHDMEP